MGNGNVDFQLVPEHIHQYNTAEQASRTWKHILLDGLSSVHDSFTMHLWYNY